MDLLLDVNIVLDVCIGREAHADLAAEAITRCLGNRGRLWLYAGSVQTLEYTLYQELKRRVVDRNQRSSNKKTMERAREVLQAFSADKHWLAALSGEGAVFGADDPEDEQLIRALGRFPAGAIKLLTRDETLLARHPDLTLSPEGYLALPPAPPKMDFIDLQSQQDAIRPRLEQHIHRVLHHGQYILGPEVKELETRLAVYTETEHCITVASGTEALLISLMALGIQPGDEVITTPFTFVATAEGRHPNRGALSGSAEPTAGLSRHWLSRLHPERRSGGKGRAQCTDASRARQRGPRPRSPMSLSPAHEPSLIQSTESGRCTTRMSRTRFSMALFPGWRTENGHE